MIPTVIVVSVYDKLTIQYGLVEGYIGLELAKYDSTHQLDRT